MVEKSKPTGLLNVSEDQFDIDEPEFDFSNIESRASSNASIRISRSQVEPSQQVQLTNLNKSEVELNELTAVEDDNNIDFDQLLFDYQQWKLDQLEQKELDELSKILNEEQIIKLRQDLKREMDEGRDTLAYIGQIIVCFTTGDEKVDLENVEMIVDQLHFLTKQDKNELRVAILGLRDEYFQLRSEGKSEKEARYFVETKIYKAGVLVTQICAVTGRSLGATFAQSGGVLIAGGFIISPLTYAFVGFLFAAQTTANYRKLKNGSISNQEFKKRLKYNGIGAGAGILGMTGGGAIGFMIGTAIFPGVGTAIGAIAGSLAGGLMGQKVAKKTLDKFDSKVVEMNQKHVQN